MTRVERRALAWLLALTAMAAGAADAGQSSPVTFARDVAPVLWSRCGECHRPNGVAPFSLIEYADARLRARQIADVTRSRYMPPWKPEPGTAEFVGSRRLTTQEIDLLTRWADGGAPEGDRSLLPAPPRWPDGWRLGVPDLVLTMPEYVVPAAPTADVFRNFVVDVPIAEARFVRGLEFLPGNPSVHHANIFVDTTGRSRALDAEDPAPGFQGLIPHSAVFPDGYFLGWTPGQAAPLASNDLAWQLTGHASLLVQVHLRSTGKPERIQPVIGLFFGNGPPREHPAMIRLGRQNIEIAPGESDYRVSDEYVLPADVHVHAVQPHSHYRARSLRAWATLPDGTEQPLISIREWDFNWQDSYRYVTPIGLPKGTRLHLDYALDNSAANPRNPTRPPERAVWGFRSADEMADLWLQVTADAAGERETLVRDIDRKMTAETIVGYESQIRVNPDYVPTRNDVAVLYMESDRPDLALPHFQRVVSLEPRSPAAHFNLGTALQATGKEPLAVEAYQQAIRLDGGYSRARERLASVYFNRAYVLDRQDRTAEAIVELRRALEVRPEWPDAMAQLAWLLATTTTSAESAQEAVTLGMRAADLTLRRDVNVLDSLAAACAAAGRMADAITIAEAAEALASASSPAMLDQIRARLALYRRGQPVRR